MEQLRFFSKYLVLIIAIYGSFQYKNFKHVKAKYFLFYIWLIVVVEFFGANFYKWFNIPNYPVYAVFGVLETTFLLWWYRSLLTSLKRKKIVTSFLILFLAYSLINVVFFQDFKTESLTYSYALEVIFLVITICYYFIEMFNNEMVLKIRKSMYFWISLGLLLFHSSFMPFYVANKFFLFGDVKLYSVVNFFLSLIMYTMFAIAFFKTDNNAQQHKIG